MILDKCFSDEYITNYAGNNISKKKTFERVVYAFHLLELLTQQEVDFVFKGGTSLMLLLDDFDRFSVDIDILMDPKYNNHINEIVNNIKGKFTEIEEDYRKPSGIAKKHFKFYYKSLYEINGDEKSYILLDVVFENYKFLELISKEFSNNFIEFTNSQKHVTTPSINSLLGDKLTAFAPKTIGILYSQNAQKYNKNTEIIKQLYDISKLFEKMTNLEVVRKTYYEIAKIQIKNRNLDISIMDCLEDTINTCKLILTKGNEYGIINEYEQIKKGYEGFRNYCIKNLYFDELLVMASKVYILCNMIKYGNIEFKKNLILKDTFFYKNWKLIKQLIGKEYFELLFQYCMYEKLVKEADLTTI